MANPAMTARHDMARPQMDWLTLTDTTTAGPTLRAWIRVHKSTFGRWLFARTV